MEIIFDSYADESNTPTFDRSKEDSKEASPQRLPEDYRTRKDSQQSGSGSDRNPSRPVANMGNSDGDSSSSSDSSDEEVKNPGPVAQSSGSSRSTGSTSGSDSEKSDASKKSEHKELTLTGKDKKTPSPKVSSRRRSPSRSASKGRKQRQSSDGRHRRSRSKDHRHKSSRTERKHGRRSRSRSRSRDRHGRPHSHDHRRRRDSHRRRRRSASRDGHRHRKPSPRHRHRSPEHRNRRREEKRRRSRSPLLGAKPEAAGVSTSATTAGTSKPPVFKVAGVKFSRGRGAGNSGSFKDIVKNEYMQRLQNAEDVVVGKTQLVTTSAPSQVTSRVATVSAGTGVMGPGGLNQVLVNQMQMHLQQTQQYVPGQPGCLTPQQKELNQKFILHTTGRTREQVEAEYGVKIPEMYNETTNNLAELAQRKKKRDMLWKTAEKKTTVNSTFNAVPILPGQSQNDKDKFLRLMGCKKGKSREETETIEDASKKEEENALITTLIRNDDLEREYESSRRHTHISRGCGLGYSTTMYQPH